MTDKGRMLELMNRAKLAWHLLGDRRVPFVTKLVPIAAIVYLVSPLNFVNEWIPVLGQIDDLAVVLLAIKLFIDLAPKDVVRQHVDGDTISASYRVRE